MKKFKSVIERATAEVHADAVKKISLDWDAPMGFQDCPDSAQDRQRFRVRHMIQYKRNPARADKSTRLQVVHPTSPTRAILWLLGRPWEGSQDTTWPTTFFRQLPCYRIPRQRANGRAAKRRRWFAFLAKHLFYRVLTELSILGYECKAHHAGNRRKGRPSPNLSRCIKAPTCAGAAAFFHDV